MPVPLYHRDFGGAGLPPLVILHGMLGSSRNWLTAGPRLSEKFHVMAVDLRNHGGSPHADDMSYEAMAGDVLAWLDLRGLERAVYLGHSLGGKVAMLLACRNPARVDRLVVADIAPKDYAWASNREAFAAMNALDLDTLKSRAAAEHQFEARVPSASMRKFLLTNLERTPAGGWRWQINLPVLTAALPALERNPLRAGDRFSGPALFIAGGRSQYVLPGDWASILGHFPAARLETIAESGHNPHLDAREPFVRMVAEG